MATPHLQNDITGFHFGMHKSCSAYAETALAMRLIPVEAPEKTAVEVDRSLAAHEMLKLPNEALGVICLEGEVWLTRDGDIEDYILSAGKRFAVRRGDQLLLQALQPSRVRVLAA